MTVINMLSFGESGVAVADEQASNPLRKHNSTQKLHDMGDSVVYGWSGPVDLLVDICEISRQQIDESRKEMSSLSLRNTHNIVNNVAINYKNRLKNNLLKSEFGIEFSDLLTGSFEGKPLDDNIKNYAISAIKEFSKMYGISILLGGMESGKFSMYNINSEGTGIRVSQQYDSIGSGSDESMKALSGYVEQLPRDQRDSINREEGLVKVIDATNASSRINVGVGGVPSIAYINDKGVRSPNEQTCILASELVKGLDVGLLDKTFVYRSVADLVYDNGDPNKIGEEMKSKAVNWDKLDRHLRGYKH